MNILMLTEYFPPYDFGGSEWSTYYLAKDLAKRGYQINILTPNYGQSKIIQNSQGIRIIRFPFYKKIASNTILTPFWQTNTLWLIWSTLNVIFFCIKYKVDLIHVQGKYFLAAAVVSKLIFGKKIVIILRDYIILCPLGMCILQGDRSCSLIQYFSKDFPYYLKNYHSGNFIAVSILLIAAVRARLISYILRLLLNFVDEKIVTSNLQKNIYLNSGIKINEVIGNSMSFEKQKIVSKKNQIIFAGRLTPGKGPQVLLKAIPTILKKFPDFTFLFCGEGFLKDQLIKMSQKMSLQEKVKFLGRISHAKLLHYLRESSLSIVPSIWPESFGRVSIESLAASTPTVVTTRVGVADYIQKNQWGIVSRPTSSQLAKSVITALTKISDLQKRVRLDRERIRKIWGDDITSAYIQIYQKLAK